MIFEFSIARKYLIPKRRQLSMSLIALMSVGVISLVVWLVLVFLSVTDGIEKTWLKKLTSLNAPIQIIPTDEYYHSYYYQIDTISEASDYTPKSIREKQVALLTDPYCPNSDPKIPTRWPTPPLGDDGAPKDLVKETFAMLDGLGLVSQDYEISGGVLKLRMVRPQGIPFSRSEGRGQSFLTQVSYISSFSGKSPTLKGLLDSPRPEDLNHLFFLASVAASGVAKDTPDDLTTVSSLEFQEKIKALFTHLEIKKMKATSHRWQSLGYLLPEGVLFDVFISKKGGAISQVVFPLEKKGGSGKIQRQGNHLLFVGVDGDTHQLTLDVPLFIEGRLEMNARLAPFDLSQIRALSDLRFDVETTLQGIPLQGETPWEGIAIAEAETHTSFSKPPASPPPWPYQVGEELFLPKSDLPAVVLPKHFQNNGVQMGDVGYFAYGATTTSAVQEQRLPVTVAGFYDPGVMAIGAKLILTENDLVHAMNAANQAVVDPQMVNGIQVFLSDLSSAKEVKEKIETSLAQKGLSPYWQVKTFHEYDFAKDLLQQFDSDKLLFTMIGAIVLIVACTNIISLLIILVNDKKKEIAILSAMGASKRSIALIFTLCGGIMGTLSTLIGTLAALLTLYNIDHVVSFLSFIQGHDAFNALFYGKSLPNELSRHALTFILIATPIISLLAGLVPALKATKLTPSQILRSE